MIRHNLSYYRKSQSRCGFGNIKNHYAASHIAISNIYYLNKTLHPYYPHQLNKLQTWNFHFHNLKLNNILILIDTNYISQLISYNNSIIIITKHIKIPIIKPLLPILDII
jgi:hypothetical protein